MHRSVPRFNRGAKAASLAAAIVILAMPTTAWAHGEILVGPIAVDLAGMSVLLLVWLVLGYDRLKLVLLTAAVISAPKWTLLRARHFATMSDVAFWTTWLGITAIPAIVVFLIKNHWDA
jgi:hypothetical protein